MKMYKCSNCGYKLKEGDIEEHDSICPKCGTDFWMANKLIKINKIIKVLHIWNCAGVAGYLAYFMKKYHDVNSVVMMRTIQDPYKLSTEFVKNLDCNFKEFVARCWLKGLRYDIIHIHSEDKMLKIFKRTLPYKKKKIIMHYHGLNIRNVWDEKKDRWKYADKIIVATPDLLEGSPEGTEYLPNVINERLCNLYKSNKKYSGSSFHVYQEANVTALEYANKHNLRFNVHHPNRYPLNHSEFLKQLSMYEYYIDVKRREGNILEAMSLTGLEALFMGVKVIRWDGKRLDSFPLEHSSVSVCELLNRIYEDLM